MNKNIIQFIVDENGQYISIPVGRVKAKSNLTTRIQLVTPITSSVAVNYLIYDSKNIEKKQYLIPTGELGSAVVDPKNPNYQLVSGWKVYEADIYAPILSVISKYRTGKVGMSFEFVEQVPNALCTNFVDYFGFTKPLPETANNGDYYICEDYNFWLNENLYNKGDILVWYNEQWNNGGILPKALTETVDISVDPAISYPTEEVDETAFGNAIGELAEDVAELDTRLNGVETDLNDKQDKVDLGLNTTVKTVVGGINEVKTQEEAHYNALNINKLDKNFNLLVERTFAQLTDFVAVRSGNDTLKMSLETLRTYLTQGLVGLSFVLVDELPPTGVAGVIYLVPSVESIVRVDTFEELPETGLENTIYITEDNNNRYQWNIDAEEYESYSHGYEEYIWLEEINKYELIGNTQVDLTGYATELWVTENFVTKTELYENYLTKGDVVAFNQGDWNAGKFLGVDDGGFVNPTDLPIREIQVNGETQEPIDGVIDIIASGKKYATVVVGTSTAGHTAEQVDYLCDGVNDEVEIQSAIDSLTSGGVVLLLNGNYNTSKPIDISNSDIELIGNKSKMIGSLSPYAGIFERSVAGVYRTKITGFDVTGLTSYTPLLYILNGSNLSNDYIILDSNIFNRVLLKLSATKYSNVYIINNITLNSSSLTYLIANTTAEIWFARIVDNGRSQIGTGIRFINSVITNNNIIQSTSLFLGGTSFDNICEDTVTLLSGSYNSYIKSNNFIVDNSGRLNNTIIQQNPSIINSLQVEKPPTLDNDAVRNVDLNSVKNLIPTQVNCYFTEATQTLFGKSFRVMQQAKPTDPIANIDTTITATTQETAQVLARFTTADGLSSEISILPQNTEVNIQAYKTSGTKNVYVFARGYVMDNAGNETLLSTSNVVTLTTTATNYTLFLPLPEYTAPAGSRAVIEIMAYKASGSGTHTARISVDDDTMSKWSYNLSLADLKLDAKNITYNNTTSGLTADNVQDALDELDNKTVEAVQVSYDNAMSGLSATNVQSAINELQSEKIDKADIVTTISGTPSDTKVASESAVYDALTSASGLTLSDNLDSPSSSVGLSTLGATKINGMQYLKTVNITVPADSEILTSSISTLIGEYFDTAYERFRIFVKFENINGLLVYFNDINSGGIFNKITGITTTSTTITDFPVIRNQAGYFDYINNGNGEEYLTYDNGDKIFTVKCNSVGSLWYRNQSISSSANFQLIVYKINGII